MSRLKFRRAIAGLALAALLVMAVPARGASLWSPGGFSPGDFWSGVWSWFTNLWPDAGLAEPGATPQAGSKQNPGPPPPAPKPPPQARNHPNGGNGPGDTGGGLDPDG